MLNLTHIDNNQSYPRFIYRVWDNRDMTYLKNTYKTLKRAAQKVQKLDLEYGAVRYHVITKRIDKIEKNGVEL